MGVKDTCDEIYEILEHFEICFALFFMKYLKYILIVVTLSSCGSSVSNLEESFLLKLQSHADSIAYKIGYGLVSGMSTVALGKESQQKLGVLIDSLLHTVGLRTAKDVSMLLDTLAGEATNAKLRALIQTARSAIDTVRDDLLGKKTGRMLAHIIQSDILGPGTQFRLQQIIAESVLGKFTERRLNEIVSSLRDTLIGSYTQTSIDSVVAHSLARVQSAANQQQSFLTKNVSTILWTLGAVIATLFILGAILFLRKNKAEKILKVVTSEIDKTKNQIHYDELTKRINVASNQQCVEKDLRVFLANNIERKK